VRLLAVERMIRQIMIVRGQCHRFTQPAAASNQRQAISAVRRDRQDPASA
jgi:hypothetical protein